MCAPAAAALLLAALTALPCRGTDADAMSTIPDDTSYQNAQPTLNKVYQMLHTTLDLHNQNKLLEFNYSNLNLVHSFGDNNPKSSVNLEKNINCCKDGAVTENLLESGAKLVLHKVDKDSQRKRKRRVVNIMRMEAENATYNVNSYEMTTEEPPNPPPLVLERKRKPGETGSSAPLLNYIFDTYSNTHQHRNERPGNGNSIYAAAAPEIEALVGSTAHLDCKVDALHDKLVSWVRRKNDEEPMELLTTGMQQYTADDRTKILNVTTFLYVKANKSPGVILWATYSLGDRYSARFIPPDIWRLEVREVRPSDAAFYDCQLSAHPPRTARVTLRVPEVSVRIVDGAGAEVSEQVCELGSTVALRCEVRGLRMEGGPSLLWYRRELLLNDDTTRGGISVRTEFGANGANSVLRVARVRNDDAGRYSCSVARAPPPSPPPAYVILHVIKGESLAELHQGTGTTTAVSKWLIIALALCVGAP